MPPDCPTSLPLTFYFTKYNQMQQNITNKIAKSLKCNLVERIVLPAEANVSKPRLPPEAKDSVEESWYVEQPPPYYHRQSCYIKKGEIKVLQGKIKVRITRTSTSSLFLGTSVICLERLIAFLVLTTSPPARQKDHKHNLSIYMTEDEKMESFIIKVTFCSWCGKFEMSQSFYWLLSITQQLLSLRASIACPVQISTNSDFLLPAME